MSEPLYYQDYPSTAVQITSGHSAEYDGANAVLLVDDPTPDTIDVYVWGMPYDTTTPGNVLRLYKKTNSVKVPLGDTEIPVSEKSTIRPDWRKAIVPKFNPVKLAPGEQLYVDQEGSDKLRIMAQKATLVNG